MTLTELSYYSRKFMPFILTGFFIFIVFFILIRAIFIAAQNSPANTPVFNPVFGKLPSFAPQHSFPAPAGISFTLDNIEGRPTTATSSAKIFFVPQKTTRFGYIQNIYLMARSFGFDTEVTKHRLEGQNAIFEDSDKKLSIDISTLNYEFSYNFQSHPELFKSAHVPDESIILDRAKEFVRLVGNFPEELASGTTHIIYLAYNSQMQTLETVDSPRKANVVEVDFFRPTIDDTPIVSPKFFTSSNFVTMVLNDLDYRVIKSNIKFFEKDAQHFGIYPVKTGDAAWDELNTGQGFIVSPGGKSYPIKIKEMFLGYYDPDFYQEYLQPVYVFLGENNFAAYVPAIQQEYVE